MEPQVWINSPLERVGPPLVQLRQEAPTSIELQVVDHSPVDGLRIPNLVPSVRNDVGDRPPSVRLVEQRLEQTSSGHIVHHSEYVATRRVHSSPVEHLPNASADNPDSLPFLLIHVARNDLLRQERKPFDTFDCDLPDVLVAVERDRINNSGQDSNFS